MVVRKVAAYEGIDALHAGYDSVLRRARNSCVIANYARIIDDVWPAHDRNIWKKSACVAAQLQRDSLRYLLAFGTSSLPACRTEARRAKAGGAKRDLHDSHTSHLNT